ncbi:MAG: isopentenyl-diphosphate Delta-isomerase [Bacteroidota bacterium]
MVSTAAITDQLILVDEQDNPIGTCEKMEAHRQGLLHRAFSVFIFDAQGRMLLQQRALSKYHSGGLWTNACCSHPFPEEDNLAAASRRLQEELGFTTSLRKVFDFYYRAEFDNGLTEHEFDHVFVGQYEGALEVNPQEVMDYCFLSLEEIQNQLTTRPDRYTAWFNIAFPRLKSWKQEQQSTTSSN